MNWALNHVMLKKQKINLAMMTLIVILATIFFHSEHYSQVEMDGVLSTDHQDCFLCHNAIDSAPKEISLASVSTGIFSFIKVEVFCFIFVLPSYVLARLRAPPHLL